MIAWIVEGFRPSSSEKKETVTFECANLKAIVRDSINKPEGDILSTEVSKITELSAENKNIRSLKGIKSLTALTSLELPSNQISDLKPLSNLTALKELDLDSNQISDLKPLSRLTALKELHLESNPLSADAFATQIPALEARGVEVR